MNSVVSASNNSNGHEMPFKRCVKAICKRLILANHEEANIK